MDELKFRRYNVTITFGGDDCPQLPAKAFTVYAIGVESAKTVALSDARNLGYKSGWVIGYEVELL